MCEHHTAKKKLKQIQELSACLTRVHVSPSSDIETLSHRKREGKPTHMARRLLIFRAAQNFVFLKT